MGRFVRGVRIAAVCTLVLILLGCGQFRSRYLPVLCELAQAQARTAAAHAIEDAVAEQIEKGKIRYDQIVFFEKNASGKITALKTNMQEVNRLKGLILRMIRQKLPAMEGPELGVPLGSLLFPAICTGGPVIPVQILSVQNASADFLSRFSHAGINQTLHQLLMDIRARGTILVFGEIRTFSVSSQVLVAETVIVGDVPNSFS